MRRVEGRPKKTVKKEMVVFKDHLARDYHNFGEGRACWGNWTFQKSELG